MSNPKPYDERYAEAARKLLLDLVNQAGSQAALGALCGFDQATIGRALKGQPQLSLLLEMRRMLRMSLEEILKLEPLPALHPITRADRLLTTGEPIGTSEQLEILRGEVARLRHDVLTAIAALRQQSSAERKPRTKAAARIPRHSSYTRRK